MAKRPATPAKGDPASGWKRALTPPQIVGGVVGVIIGISSVHEGPTLARVLRLAGYPTACSAIVRWVPIVRHRRVDWLVAHELGMAAVCLGWVLAEQWGAAGVNGAWAAIALAWWVIGAKPHHHIERPDG